MSILSAILTNDLLMLLSNELWMNISSLLETLLSVSVIQNDLWKQIKFPDYEIRKLPLA